MFYHEIAKGRKYENQLTTLLISKVGFAKFNNKPTFKPVALRYDLS